MNEIEMKKPSIPTPEDISQELAPTLKFNDSEREAVYRAIYTRRDVRNEFGVSYQVFSKNIKFYEHLKQPCPFK